MSDTPGEPSPPTASAWDKAAVWTSASAALLAAITLALGLLGGIFVTEAEMRDALTVTETELREALTATETELREALAATETELREALAAAEQRITGEIRANTQRTDAQMEELRRYMLNHLDRQAAGAPSAPR